MLMNEFIQQQQWKDREAEWNQKVKRGDFVSDAKPSAKPSVPTKRKSSNTNSFLQKIGLA